MQHTATIQGATVPKLGIGTWQIEGAECVEAVRHALELGYRHIDTARAYGNEAEVGEAIAAASVDRDEIFLTTKIWRAEMAPGDLQEAAEDSLRTLRTDYVDLLLLHWPNDKVPLDAMLEALDEVRAAGKARHVGVSNYPAGLLRDALDAKAPIFCDQVEFHPFLAQTDLLELCRERDVLLTAYSPIAQGEVLDDPVLAEIGEAHGASAVQVTLAWLLAQDHVAAIPRSTSAENREANFRAFDIELSEDERLRIDGLARGQRLIDPPFAPDWAA